MNFRESFQTDYKNVKSKKVFSTATDECKNMYDKTTKTSYFCKQILRK